MYFAGQLTGHLIQLLVRKEKVIQNFRSAKPLTPPTIYGSYTPVGSRVATERYGVQLPPTVAKMVLAVSLESIRK